MFLTWYRAATNVAPGPGVLLATTSKSDHARDRDGTPGKSIDTLFRICDALEISAANLVERVDAATTRKPGR